MSVRGAPPPAGGTAGEQQRRTVRVLVASQVLGGVGAGAGIAVVSLLAFELAGTASVAGIPPTAATLGAALGALVIGRIAVTSGRRPGLALGYLVGAGGALGAIVAAVTGWFLLHVLSSLAFGGANASNLQARYAATDLATEDRRASALSTVVWATTVGAVLGPNLIGAGARVAAVVGLPALAGPYLFSGAAFAGAALIQLVWLRPDPLLLARQASGRAPVALVGAGEGPEHVPQPGTAAAPTTDRPVRDGLRVIRAQPAARSALVAIGAAHATMIGLMVMTPVHMEGEGASLRLVGLTISAHVAGMYALSPLVGRAADRLGHRVVLLAGCAQLAAAAALVAAVPPTGQPAFQAGLLLLGTGWSCCLVAGSASLTGALAPEQRPAAQGASDLVMNLSGGVGGTVAGLVLAVASYEFLAMGALCGLLIPGLSVWRSPERPGGPRRSPATGAGDGRPSRARTPSSVSRAGRGRPRRRRSRGG